MLLSLRRCNPVRDLLTTQDQFLRTLEEGLGSLDTDMRSWYPPADIKEDDNKFILTSDIPGFSKDSIDISLENNLLTISGERTFEDKEKKEDYHRIERVYGKFTRSFTLPAQTDSEKVSAAYQDGVLTVTIPKAESSKPKKISIKG